MQCLHTSLDINHRMPSWASRCSRCSMNATCRHVDPPSRTVLS
ncbi:MAG: hypothetical protein R2755_22495 [Acidimicrobiales bacterium]